MRKIVIQTFIAIGVFLLHAQVQAEGALCKHLFHVTLHEQNALQTLAQQALTISEKLARTPSSFFSLKERLLWLELRRVHKKMLVYVPTPESHPGALFVRNSYSPEFYWQTTVSMRTGGLQTRVPLLTQAQRDDLHYVSSPEGLVHAASGETIKAPIAGDFVIGLDQQIYIAHDVAARFPFFRHSSFFAGGPVLFAGHILVQPNGLITYISRSSGHYQPSQKHFAWALDFLSKAGFAFAESSY